MARRSSGSVPDSPGVLDLRVILVAAVVASPAVLRAAQGLLTVNEALIRVAMVVVGCLAVAAVVRSLWPLLAGVAAAESATASLPDPASVPPDQGVDTGLDTGLDSAFDSAFDVGVEDLAEPAGFDALPSLSSLGFDDGGR